MGKAIYHAIAPRGGFAGRAFGLKFGPFALSQVVPGVWPFLILLWHGPTHWRVWVAAALALKIIGGGVLVAAIVARCFPVIVNAEGLRARNFWGQAREIAWREITGVAPIRWLVFTRFARVSTVRGRNMVWLPLFLREQSEFENAVGTWAAPENPLRLFFENGETVER